MQFSNRNYDKNYNIYEEDYQYLDLLFLEYMSKAYSFKIFFTLFVT